MIDYRSLRGPALHALAFADMSDAFRHRRRAILRSWAQWCTIQEVHLLDATHGTVMGWKKHLTGRGLKPATVADHLGHIRSMYTRLIRAGVTAANPVAGVVLPRRPRRSQGRWLTADEARRVLDASAPPHESVAVALLVRLMLLSGLRRKEALDLGVKDLTQVAGAWCVTVQARKDLSLDTIALPDQVAELALSCRGGRRGGYLAVLPAGALRESRLVAALHRIADKAHLPVFGTRVLRTTFITLSLEAGVPPRDVMYSAGHTNLAMTSYYDRGYASIARNAGPRLTAWLSTDSDVGTRPLTVIRGGRLG